MPRRRKHPHLPRSSSSNKPLPRSSSSNNRPHLPGSSSASPPAQHVGAASAAAAAPVNGGSAGNKAGNAKARRAAAGAGARGQAGGAHAARYSAPQLAALALQAQAALARTDPKAFFSFVIKEEHTRAPLVCLPHQRVVLDFVLAHPQCVLRLPIGASKTYLMLALTLWFLGRDLSSRGAVVCAGQDQAIKFLAAVRDYIDTSPELKLVFPHLRRSPRAADPWTQTAITVDRPPGIRDRSLRAFGLDSQTILGSRLSWVVADDLLSQQNTSGDAGLAAVHDFVDSSVVSRLDTDGRFVLTNTPWHPNDVTYRLQAAGLPTLTADIDGFVHLANCPDWDTDDIRPSKRPGEWYRLTAHDPDPDEQTGLWPAKYTAEFVAAERARRLPHRFNQQFYCVVRDDDTARCKTEWIDRCRALGKRLSLEVEYKGPHPTVTGVDLAVGQTAAHDMTAWFTAELRPDGRRRILDVEAGRFDGPTIVAKTIRKSRQFNSIVRVENNAAQDYIRQFMLASNASVPVKAHTTGRQKAHPEFGVEGLFIELQNGAWIIPSRYRHKWLDEWCKQCLFYEPGKHTHDLLMASYLAREQARDLGMGTALLTDGHASAAHTQQPSLAMNILSR